jgi:hypothetical protein
MEKLGLYGLRSCWAVSASVTLPICTEHVYSLFVWRASKIVQQLTIGGNVAEPHVDRRKDAAVPQCVAGEDHRGPQTVRFQASIMI